jgi:hypothetical protein
MNQARYAIVGYAFRMPGGIATADGFWRLLAERAYVREPIADRYGPGYEPAGGQGGPGRFGSGYEGLMRGDEPYLFDCHLFGVPAREASVMDPQLRTSQLTDHIRGGRHLPVWRQSGYRRPNAASRPAPPDNSKKRAAPEARQREAPQARLRLSHGNA